MKIIVFSIFISFIAVSASYAWDDCPFGQKYDPFPGKCGGYADTDKDGICDHSEPAPDKREVIIKEVIEEVKGPEKVPVKEIK